ncbi:MAG: hypothetical protein IRZ05_16215 [Micromonosporaceae bacterium]|jgi:hypothetical protein|nr:hypothetical protein [Micromonosporaceae bacterium]
MKISPSADYYVRVRPQEWDAVPASVAPLYAGIFEVDLNYLVDVAFVPDLSSVAPPWDFSRLPANIDEITTAEQARLATVFTSSYAVTPNDRLAGTQEAVDDCVVFYVSTRDFSSYAKELERLAELAGSVHSMVRVSQLRGHQVIEFIEHGIVASGRLSPAHAAELGQRP